MVVPALEWKDTSHRGMSILIPAGRRPAGEQSRNGTASRTVRARWGERSLQRARRSCRPRRPLSPRLRYASRLAFHLWFSLSASVSPSPASSTHSSPQRLPILSRRLHPSFSSTRTSTACSLPQFHGAGPLPHLFRRPSRRNGDGCLPALNLVGLLPYTRPPVAI